MCLTSEHSDNERDAVSGIMATKGFPGGWIGQTEAVGLGKWDDVNAYGWRWSDGSDGTYVAPWKLTAKAGTTYDGLSDESLANINSITEGRAKGARVIAFAGSQYLTLGHCGAQLVNKEWSGMKCSMRWPAICAPCMASGATKIKKTDVCHECRLVKTLDSKTFLPSSEATKPCYTKDYCDSFRPSHIPTNPRWEEPFPWMRTEKTERIIIYVVICPILCLGFCWIKKVMCFAGFGKDQALEDEE